MSIGDNGVGLHFVGSIIVGVFSIWRHQGNTRGTDAVSVVLSFRSLLDHNH